MFGSPTESRRGDGFEGKARGVLRAVERARLQLLQKTRPPRYVCVFVSGDIVVVFFCLYLCVSVSVSLSLCLCVCVSVCMWCDMREGVRGDLHRQASWRDKNSKAAQWI